MIQVAQERHLDEILNIEKILFTHPWTREQLKSDLTLKTNAENWVFLENKYVVGYILGWIIMNDYHLNNIAVQTDFQRRHIGRLLIEHVITQLQNQDIQQIYLEVSWKNKPAQKLYASLGFQQKGIRKDYYENGDHALLYDLNLDANG